MSEGEGRPAHALLRRAASGRRRGAASGQRRGAASRLRRRVLPDVETSLWRAVTVFRVLVLGYAVVVASGRLDDYRDPAAGALVLAGMLAWTAFSAWAYAARRRRGWLLLVADLAVAVAALLATLAIETPAAIAAGAPTIPTFWVASSVLAWAVWRGAAGGAAAAAVLGVTSLVERGSPTPTTLANIYLLFLAGIVVGYVTRLALAAEESRARAAELAAATAERERLARSIHDGVLQVLALVQRRAPELGPNGADLGALAGEQERALRALVAGQASGPSDEVLVDVRLLLHQAAATRPGVTVSAPATPVALPGRMAREMVAAAAAALDNVTRHVGPGAPAWVLLEDEGDAVVVTVRDEGPGFPPERLEHAAAEGRLGVAASIRGRLADLGGTATIVSAPGAGTEVELRLPAGAARSA